MSNLTRCSVKELTAPVPNFLVAVEPGQGWTLYGGRLQANVPAEVTLTPAPDDADPLPCRIRMTVDVVDGRLACTSLAAERLDDSSPAITGELLRRIPVATYVRLAALEMRHVVMERVDGKLREVGDLPPADFTRGGMTDESLETFARLYALVQISGGKPSGVLLSDYGMPRATSSRWLATARRRGILVEDHQRFDVWEASRRG